MQVKELKECLFYKFNKILSGIYLSKKKRRVSITKDVLLLLMNKIRPDTFDSAFNDNSIFNNHIQKSFAKNKLFLNIAENYISDRDNEIVYATNLLRDLKRIERRLHLCTLLIHNKNSKNIYKLI